LLDPAILSVWSPAVADPPDETVGVALICPSLGGVTGLVNDVVTSVGTSPDQAWNRLTGELNPPTDVTVILDEFDELTGTINVVGDAEREKFGTLGPQDKCRRQYCTMRSCQWCRLGGSEARGRLV